MSARYAIRGVVRCCSASSARGANIKASASTASLSKVASARRLAQGLLPMPSRLLHTSAILRLASHDGKREKDSARVSPASLQRAQDLTSPLPSKVTSAVSRGVFLPKQGDVCSSSFSYAQYQPEKLSEDILTVPNVLTIMRLASTPVLGYLILIDEMPYALGLLALSGFTDVLDGWLARRYKSATVFGSIADPAADKALMTVMVGALAWRGMIPLPLVLLIVGRDVALVISAFLIRYRSLPEPKTFSRYWDPRLPSAKVEPTQISKYNTFLQIVLVAGCTLIASFNENWRQWWNTKDGLWNDKDEGASVLPTSIQKDWGDFAKKAWHGFMIVVSFTTVWSGSSYLFGSRGVQYLSQRAKQASQQVLKKQVK